MDRMRSIVDVDTGVPRVGVLNVAEDGERVESRHTADRSHAQAVTGLGVAIPRPARADRQLAVQAVGVALDHRSVGRVDDGDDVAVEGADATEVASAERFVRTSRTSEAVRSSAERPTTPTEMATSVAISTPAVGGALLDEVAAVEDLLHPLGVAGKGGGGGR
jgi:hypothetical protein